MRRLLLLPALLLALPAAAQSAAPTVVSVTTAASSADDARVTVRGEITEVIRREHVRLTDASGTIEVEIDDDLMRPEDVRVGMRVQIDAEVDRERDGVELEAKRITVL